jgi:hypothetical protein
MTLNVYVLIQLHVQILDNHNFYKSLGSYLFRDWRAFDVV